MFNWSALTLAVQDQWGGPDSKGKREWFAGAISDLFVQRPNTDLEDVETMLLQVMLDEFEVNVDDASAFDVAQQIVRLRADTLKGDFAEVDAMHTAWAAKSGRDQVRYQHVERGEDADETEWDSSSAEGSDDDGEVKMDVDTEAPTLVQAREKPAPEVDDEGFTKVVGRKKR